MKELLKRAKTLNIKDIPCIKCIRCKIIPGFREDGYCTRFHGSAASVRKLCVKTEWYVEMCTMDAMLESEMK